MHLLIPFAAPLSAAGREALAARSWHGLNVLLKHARVLQRHEGDEFSYSPPHEHALAQALGWQGGDGCLPFAARQAKADGISVGPRAWGLVTPTHWRLGAEHVSLADPASLALEDSDSRLLFDAVRELFTSAGYALEWGSAQRWYTAHESLAHLPTASLDRVAGRNVDHWLQGAGSTRDSANAAGDATRRSIRRLQSEVQMLLHEHPINSAREGRGLLPVNSFWLSGCGVAQSDSAAAIADGIAVEMGLVAPALAEDWAAWSQAWAALEAGPLAQWVRDSRPASRLTLCGERGWVQLSPAPSGLRATLQSWFHKTEARSLLESL
jgi:hypothetical protein